MHATSLQVIDFGGTDPDLNQINNSDQITGEADFGSVSDQAAFYSNGTSTNLGAMLGGFSDGETVGNSGVVGGYYSTRTGFQAFTYSGGVVKTLTPLVAGGNAEVTGINASGTTVGYAATSTGINHAVIFGASPQDIGTLGGTTSEATAVNSAGQIVGSASLANGQSHAFLYSSGVMTNLGTLGGDSSSAFNINSSGMVVGESNLVAGSFTYDSFLYYGGVMHDIAANGAAAGINAAGQVVGTLTSGSKQYGYTYTIALGLQVLNTTFASLLVSGTGTQAGFVSLESGTASTIQEILWAQELIGMALRISRQAFSSREPLCRSLVLFR